MTGPSEALSFGRVASDYDRLRPGYPAEAVAWVARHVAGRRAVEIGAGTGKATVEFMRAGFSVTAVEPDPAMAEVGRARVPAAEWVVAAAETWEGEPDSCDLVYGAQSWHWVPAEADGRLATMLSAEGAMAWMWNHPDLAPEEVQFADLYARYMPARQDSHRLANHRRAVDYWKERLGAVMEDVAVFEVPWERRMGADDYVALIATYSDHIALPPEDRVALQNGIRARLVDQGGTIDLAHLTRVYLGLRPRR